jgi:hypothetical protein
VCSWHRSLFDPWHVRSVRQRAKDGAHAVLDRDAARVDVADIARRAREANLEAPALIVVGEVVARRTSSPLAFSMDEVGT